ncbi:hypothetical protein [Haloplanus halophilus]|uniref:hypothetical protein n=1 Tax=Haloplanus halophilus TaxID=2949993 RepID=UPI00203BD1D3|nr:hypothetical protein [Haloplanus sp. GDY1]
MSTEPTTLSDFADDADGGDSAGMECGGAPTPAETSPDIDHLADCVETLADQVGTLVDELEKQDTTGGIDTKPATAERMFQ